MKKSEKKSVVFSDEVTITSIKNDDNNDNAMPVEALPVVDDFTGLKKKKKEKKKAEESAEGDGTPATAIITDDFDFGKRKKKKKPAESSISSNGNVDADAMETRSLPSNAGSDVSIGANIVDTNKNEGGDDTNAPGEEISIGGADNKSSYLNDDGETWLGTARDYTYPELLGRVFGIIRQNNPELAGEKKRYTIAPPQVFREGTKKTVFANVGDIARRMRRTPDHLIQYLFAELGTTGSVDGQERLVIKGKFVQKQIETVLKRYIVEYVTCRNCKSADTNLTKDNRLFFLNCQSCGSTRSVSAIKTGFMAQTTKRAAARAAAQT